MSDEFRVVLAGFLAVAAIAVFGWLNGRDKPPQPAGWPVTPSPDGDEEPQYYIEEAYCRCVTCKEDKRRRRKEGVRV